MTEQVLDLKGLVTAVRRSWRTVAAVTVLGVLLGAGYGITRPQTYTSKALVLLPTSGASSSGASAPNSTATDARLATSAAVLVPAGQTVDRSLSLAALQRRVTAAPSDTASVVSISATGPSPSEAEDLADAVADKLVAFVTDAGSVTATAAVGSLQSQLKSLTEQLAVVQEELRTVGARLAREGTTSRAGRQDADLVSDYTSEQTSLQLQLSSVKSQITETQLGQVSANQGTEVVQRATSASSSRMSSILLKVAVGLLLGLVVGCVVVLARRRRDARLYCRDDLGAAVGAPVVLSLDTQPPRSSAAWVEMFECYEPRAAEQWNVRTALRELGLIDEYVSRLEMLVLAGDAPAAALAGRMAISAAESKIDTAFVFVDDGSLPALRSACQQLGQRDERTRPGLEVGTEDGPAARSAQLTMIARTVDLSSFVPAEPGPAAVTVLAVTAGTATADQLARVAIAAADAGQRIRAILVANPGPDDRTTGRYPGQLDRASLVLQRRMLGPITTARRSANADIALSGAAAISPARGGKGRS